MGACLLAGCAPAVPAPDNIEALVVYGFTEFEREGALEEVSDKLFPWVDDNEEGLKQGFGVDALDSNHLSSAGVTNQGAERIVGALGSALYRVDPVRVADGISHPRKQDIYEGTTAWEILESGDRDCFLAQSCDAYTFKARETADVPVAVSSIRVVTNEMRWVPDAAGDVMLAIRQLAPEPTDFQVKLMAVDQQYNFILVRPHEGGSQRIEAIWVDAKVLGVAVPEGEAVRQAVSRMQKSADDIDAFFLD